jgi:glycosyltransferase involved in cell wall biosynthesis
MASKGNGVLVGIDGRCAVSVIVPTRNEAGNVRELTQRLAETMAGTGFTWELLFVDDSDDDTPDRIAALCREFRFVRLVYRVPEERQGGLSGAVVAGFFASEGRVMVVMDGDLQHPPEIVPSLAAPVLSGACSIAVGSRYVEAAGLNGLAGPYRRMVSQVARMAVRSVFPRIRAVRDPLSGLFGVHRCVITDAPLAPEGFKILLEILMRGDWDELREVSYEFASRQSGGSKAGWREGTQFLRHVFRLRFLTRPASAPLTNAPRQTQVATIDDRAGEAIAGPRRPGREGVEPVFIH